MQIAVLKEMDAKGPFVSLVMGVVVLKDVVVVVLFAINLQLAPLVSACVQSDPQTLSVLQSSQHAMCSLCRHSASACNSYSSGHSIGHTAVSE